MTQVRVPIDLEAVAASLSYQQCQKMIRLCHARCTRLGIGLDASEKEACEKGHWLEAIKMLRDRTGADLRTARDVVDAYRERIR